MRRLVRILLVGSLVISTCTVVGAIFHFEWLLGTCALLVVGMLFVLFRFSDGVLRFLQKIAASGLLTQGREQTLWMTRALEHAKDWSEHLRSILFTILWNLSLWVADLYATLLDLPGPNFSESLQAKALFTLSCLSLAAYAQSRDLKRSKVGLLSWILNYFGALSFYFTMLRFGAVVLLSDAAQTMLTHWLVFPIVFVLARVLRVDDSVGSSNLLADVLGEIEKYAVPILLVALVVVIALIATTLQWLFGSRDKMDSHSKVEKKQRRSVAAEVSFVAWFMSPVLIWLSLVVMGLIGSI